MSPVEPIERALDILKTQTTLDQWGVDAKPPSTRKNKLFGKLERKRRYDEIPNSVKMHILPKSHEHFPHEFHKEVNDLTLRDPWASISRPGGYLDTQNYLSHPDMDNFLGHGRPVQNKVQDDRDTKVEHRAPPWGADIHEHDNMTAFRVTQDHLDAQNEEKALEWVERLHRLRGNEERISTRLPTRRQAKEWFGRDGLLLTPQEEQYLEHAQLSRTLGEQEEFLRDLSQPGGTAQGISGWHDLEEMGFSEDGNLPRHYPMPFAPMINPRMSRDSTLPEYDWSLDKTTGWKGVEPIGAMRFMDRKYALGAQKRGIKGRHMDEDSLMWEHENDPRAGAPIRPGGRMPFDEGEDERLNAGDRWKRKFYSGNFMFPAPSFLDRIDDSGSPEPTTERVRNPKFGGQGQKTRQWVGVRGDPSKMEGQFANRGQSLEGAEGFVEGDFPPEQLVTGGLPESWTNSGHDPYSPTSGAGLREWQHLPYAWLQHLMGDDDMPQDEFGRGREIAGWEQRNGMYTFYDINREPLFGPIHRDELAEKVGGFPWPE